MSSPPSNFEPSGGEAPSKSTSFDLLARPVQRWIWQNKWQELREVQERAIALLLQNEADAIIAAATAAGKTEAAFLPLLSRLVTSTKEATGFDIVYVSPLKALINDQFQRLDGLCELLEVPVHRWHGDVSAAAKAKARRNPKGVLLITPESMEAMFVLRGLEIPGLFAALKCVVVDELHAMLDTERGVQLRSLLNRVEIAIGRSVRRVGLSATIGDMNLARSYLRPSAPEKVALLQSETKGQNLKLQLRGYIAGDAAGEQEEEHSQPTDRAIARHLFEWLRGDQNLVFAGSRGRVELYTDLLRRMSEEARLPNEFYAHHASLARDHREFVEHRLKQGAEPTTAVCTSTLELGIDIGEVESVAQIGAPFSVSSMRQRLGRSGRRAGKPAIMRVYIKESALEAASHLLDTLRLDLVQSVAMIDLLVDGWCEPPRRQALHLSTLVHQILSVIAERGGARAKTLFDVLCRKGPFGAVDAELFAEILRCLGGQEPAPIEQSVDGTLLLGAAGERLVEHYSFYTVFVSPEEYRVMESGHTLGTLPVNFALVPNTTIIFSGRRWRIQAIHDQEKVIEVAPDAAGKPPIFGKSPGDLHDVVADRMLAVYTGTDVPPYLDPTACDLLSEGRAAFRRHHLDRVALLALGEKKTLLFPWRGTRETETLTLALIREGIEASFRTIVIEVDASPQDTLDALEALSQGPAPSAVELADHIENLQSEKYHAYLDRSLLTRDVAARRLSTDVVPHLARAILSRRA